MSSARSEAAENDRWPVESSLELIISGSIIVGDDCRPEKKVVGVCRAPELY